MYVSQWQFSAMITQRANSSGRPSQALENKTRVTKMGEAVTLYGYRRMRDHEPCRHGVPLSTREKHLCVSQLLLEHGEKNSTDDIEPLASLSVQSHANCIVPPNTTCYYLNGLLREDTVSAVPWNREKDNTCYNVSDIMRQRHLPVI